MLNIYRIFPEHFREHLCEHFIVTVHCSTFFSIVPFFSLKKRRKGVTLLCHKIACHVTQVSQCCYSNRVFKDWLRLIVSFSELMSLCPIKFLDSSYLVIVYLPGIATHVIPFTPFTLPEDEFLQFWGLSASFANLCGGSMDNHRTHSTVPCIGINI